MSKVPCKECPFRKESLPGWIGGHEDPSEITKLVLADQRFPCHLDVNKLMHDGGHTFEDAAAMGATCIGSLAFMNNQHKRSRGRATAMLQDEVGKRDDVFKCASAMHAHHRREPEQGWGYPMLSKKAHYFVEGRSLCNRWLFTGCYSEQTPPTDNACATCTKKRATKR